MGEPSGGVREFYAGRAVFITGATGYLGKVTVEKLLRSCPEISKVYMLVRPKKGKDAKDRLSELLSSPAFDRLKKERPGFESKIILIAGNIEEAGLGISESDVAMVAEDTSVVIHNAATVRFTEPLKKAVQINIVGLQQMIYLGRKMKKLEAFVHVSTAYSNCVKPVIHEQLYPQRITPQQIISACSWMSDEEIDVMLPHILGDYPNTYTFTKSLAELLLEEEKGNLPAAIVRPSIIVSSQSDPVPGWIDGLSGANGLFALQGQGTLRKMLGYNNNIADLIPVDHMANSSIVAGWKLAKDKPKATLIVNMTSGQLKPIRWGDVYQYGAEHQYNSPSKTVIRPPVYNMYTSKMWLRNLFKVMDHYVPAAIFDFFSRITGQSPRYMRSVRGLWRFAQSVEYFTCREWVFTNNNTIALHRDMSPDERRTFNFDMTTVDWREFCRHWWLGTRMYVWREDMSKQPEYNKRFSRICLRRRLIKISTSLLLLVAIIQTTPATQQYTGAIWKTATDLVSKIKENLVGSIPSRLDAVTDRLPATGIIQS